MSNKIVVVTDHNVSKELDLICSIYPNSEVLLFSSGNEIVHSHVSCFDFTDLAGVDHVRQIVSLRDSRSHDFYMISYDTLLVFTKIRTTRPTGGLLWGYKPLLLGQRLKTLAFSFGYGNPAYTAFA